MNILILDDDLTRHELFKKNFAHHNITSVETVDQAIKLLQTRIYDAVFLDHDLGGHSYVESGGAEPTGYDVAKWLSEHPEHKPKSIYIHSMNPVGADKMHKLLPGSKLAPSLWTMKQ